MSDKKYYQPLPESVTVKKSGIHGLGLYSTQKIDAGVVLGITHIKDGRFENGYSRTPLGGFFNHSETPNCEVIYDEYFIYLKTLVEIGPDIEMTAKYTFYNPQDSQPIDSNSFLQIVKSKCEEAGVKYLFPESEKVSYPGYEDMMVSGYFADRPEPILACAVGKPVDQWFEILVHESCHMDQWIEQAKVWTNCISDGIDCDKKMDEWLSGKEYTYFIRTMQALEIDCEKRSIEKIKHLNLPINVTNYIKKANSYLFFYSILLETKKWSDVAPYEIPEIIEMMPDYFLENDEQYYVLSEELSALYKEKCYNVIN